MLRPIDVARLGEEFRRMQRLNETAGVPRIAGHFQRVLKEGWVNRNPEIFHLYEEDERLRGYAGLIPVYPDSYRRFIDGERFPWPDARPTDFLTAEEYARARKEGVWVWIESFMAVDAAVRTALAEWVYTYLSEMHVKGLLVSSSDAQGEADCRWLGMVHRRDGAPCPTGTRKLWYAEEAVVASDDGHDFGPPVPVRLLFLTVRQRFSQQPQTLGLVSKERRVARLFYLEDKKAVEVGRLLGMQPGTVKTHQQRIRAKAQPVVGSRLARRIATCLH